MWIILVMSEFKLKHWIYQVIRLRYKPGVIKVDNHVILRQIPRVISGKDIYAYFGPINRR